jgi:hypothetical protein
MACNFVDSAKNTRIFTLFCLLIVFAFASAPTAAAAERDVWRWIGLSAHRISAMSVDPEKPGTIYAGTFAGELFKLFSDGKTWVSLDFPSKETITAIAIDSRNSENVYAATSTGIFTSRDAGATWVPESHVAGSRALTVDPQSPTTVYAGTENGVFTSSDSGRTWLGSLVGEDVTSIAVDPYNAAVLYAGTSSGFHKSIDGARTWSRTSWTFGPVRTVAVDPVNSEILYAGTDAGISKSIDAGQTWVTYGLTDVSVHSIAVDMQESNTLYALTNFGPHKSVDGGKNWEAIPQGLSTSVPAALSADSAICKMYVGTNDGVFEADMGPVLTLRSNPCIGGKWTVSVTHALGSAPVRLTGVSNGLPWEVPVWATANGAGAYTTSGMFGPDTEGAHQIQVEVGGVRSNIVRFEVAACRNRQ